MVTFEWTETVYGSKTDNPTTETSLTLVSGLTGRVIASLSLDEAEALRLFIENR